MRARLLIRVIRVAAASGGVTAVHSLLWRQDFSVSILHVENVQPHGKTLRHGMKTCTHGFKTGSRLARWHSSPVSRGHDPLTEQPAGECDDTGTGPPRCAAPLPGATGRDRPRHRRDWPVGHGGDQHPSDHRQRRQQLCKPCRGRCGHPSGSQAACFCCGLSYSTSAWHGCRPLNAEKTPRWSYWRITWDAPVPVP